jgi:hypothetical protein
MSIFHWVLHIQVEPRQWLWFVMWGNCPQMALFQLGWLIQFRYTVHMYIYIYILTHTHTYIYIFILPIPISNLPLTCQPQESFQIRSLAWLSQRYLEATWKTRDIVFRANGTAQSKFSHHIKLDLWYSMFSHYIPLKLWVGNYPLVMGYYHNRMS